MASTQQVLDASTQAAQTAAAAIGGSFDASKGGFVPAATPPANTIPADQLGKNATTYSSYFPTPTAATGLAESATASKDAYIANTAKQADELSTDQGTGKGAIQDLLTKLGVRGAAKTSAYEGAGLNDTKKEIDDLTTQMETRSRSYDKQILALQKDNPDGMLRSGVDAQVNQLNQQKASELADLAIVLNSKTRNYDTAKSIVDQKVDAQTEDLKTQLNGLQYFYSENASKLTQDQQTLLQAKISAADKEYQATRDNLTKVGQVQLEAAKNGAPISVVRAIGQAQDEESAIVAGKGYLKTPTAATGLFTTDDTRTVVQAGLSGASQRTQTVFLHTPKAFQDAFIRNGSGTPAATPENIAASLAEWEKLPKPGSDAEALQSLIDSAKASGGGP